MLPILVVSSMADISGCMMFICIQLLVSRLVLTSRIDLVALGALL